MGVLSWSSRRHGVRDALNVDGETTDSFAFELNQSSDGTILLRVSGQAHEQDPFGLDPLMRGKH